MLQWYLGIVISKDQKSRCKINFEPTLQKTKAKLNHWLLRDSSLKGRILLSKAEGLSRLVYTATSLAVSQDMCKAIDTALFNFIWRIKTHYIRKSIIRNTYESGRLNFLDFNTLNNIFKINWIRHFFLNPNSLWNFIPNHVFSRIGSLDFLLICNYKIEKNPSELIFFSQTNVACLVPVI